MLEVSQWLSGCSLWRVEVLRFANTDEVYMGHSSRFPQNFIKPLFLHVDRTQHDHMGVCLFSLHSEISRTSSDMLAGHEVVQSQVSTPCAQHRMTPELLLHRVRLQRASMFRAVSVSGGGGGGGGGGGMCLGAVIFSGRVPSIFGHGHDYTCLDNL